MEIFGDSLLVIKQLTGEYECKDDVLRVYHKACLDLLREFKTVTLEHVPKIHNEDANQLAQSASGYRLILAVEYATGDWRKDIADYLKGGLGAAVEPTVCNRKVPGSSPSLCTFVWVRLGA